MDAKDFPEYFARVKATRYREGSRETGDLADPEFEFVGTVIDTPRSGSAWLTIKTDDRVPGRNEYDVAAPEAWSIGEQHIHLSAGAAWNWGFEVVGPQAAVIALVVDQRGMPAEVIAAAVRATLLSLSCELIRHNWTPDLDTVADCAGLDKVAAIEITS